MSICGCVYVVTCLPVQNTKKPLCYLDNTGKKEERKRRRKEECRNDNKKKFLRGSVFLSCKPIVKDFVSNHLLMEYGRTLTTSILIGVHPKYDNRQIMISSTPLVG